MKTTRILTGLALALAISAQAQVTVFEWQFGDGSNPAVPTSSTPPWTAEAAISVGSGTGYHFGAYLGDPAFTGSRTGVWEVQGGSSGFALSVDAFNAEPGTPLTYTLVVDRFSDGSGFYANSLNFSIGAPDSSNQTTLESAAFGDWFRNTYTWSFDPGSEAIALVISPDGTGGLPVDRLQFTVDGNITAVPEPAVTQAVVAAGLVAFGVWWRRKQLAA